MATAEQGSVRERFLDILKNQLGLGELEDIDLIYTFEEFGADSLDVTELLMELEEEFDINIKDDDFRTPKGLLDAVEELVAKKTSPSAL